MDRRSADLGAVRLIDGDRGLGIARADTELGPSLDHLVVLFVHGIGWGDSDTDRQRTANITAHPLAVPGPCPTLSR